MHETRHARRRHIIDTQPEIRVTRRDGIRRHQQVVLIARHIDMSVRIHMPLKHLAFPLGVEDERIFGIDMQVEREIAELVMRDAAGDIHGVVLRVEQVHIGEADGESIHDDGVMRDGVTRTGPRQCERSVMRASAQQHIRQTRFTAYYHATGSFAV